LDEAQFSEFVHEEIDPGPRRANHLCQHFLRNFRKHFSRLAWLAMARKEQQNSRRPFLAGVKELNKDWLEVVHKMRDSPSN
jgi:hypothetical protein